MAKPDLKDLHAKVTQPLPWTLEVQADRVSLVHDANGMRVADFGEAPTDAAYATAAANEVPALLARVEEGEAKITLLERLLKEAITWIAARSSEDSALVGRLPQGLRVSPCEAPLHAALPEDPNVAPSEDLHRRLVQERTAYHLAFTRLKVQYDEMYLAQRQAMEEATSAEKKLASAALRVTALEADLARAERSREEWIKDARSSSRHAGTLIVEGNVLQRQLGTVEVQLQNLQADMGTIAEALRLENDSRDDIIAAIASLQSEVAHNTGFKQGATEFVDYARREIRDLTEARDAALHKRDNLIAELDFLVRKLNKVLNDAALHKRDNLIAELDFLVRKLNKVLNGAALHKRDNLIAELDFLVRKLNKVLNGAALHKRDNLIAELDFLVRKLNKVLNGVNGVNGAAQHRGILASLAAWLEERGVEAAILTELHARLSQESP